MVYIRGHRNDYDGWAKDGNPGWGFDEVLPYFKKHENHEAGASASHGTGGELNVAKLRTPSALALAFVDAAAETQYRRNRDFNGADQDGFGEYEVTQKNGERWSSACAFLHPALTRPNLIVYDEAMVLRVRFAGKRAIGPSTVKRHGETFDLNAAREIILSGGAINSPQLLMLSGIGNAERLRTLGIELVHELPGVGENLQDHPTVAIMAEEKSGSSYALRLGNLPKMAWSVAEFLFARRGILTTNLVETGGFTRTRPDAANPDLQFTFMPTYKVTDRFVANFHGFGVYLTVLRPKSRGTVELVSADPEARPKVVPNFLEDEEDIAILVHGLKATRQILSAAQVFAAPRQGKPCRARPSSPMRRCAIMRSRTRARCFTRSAPARWGRTATRWRCSIIGCACAVSRACASPMPRSCPILSAATPMRQA